MEALYYTKQDNDTVMCQLCPHHCHLLPGVSGACRCRYNDHGLLTTLNYGQCTSAAMDPIEKKPLRRFHPGSLILSLGSWGCNLACSFCQNWEISQCHSSCHTITPQEAAALAIQEKEHGNIGLAYTYNEPVVWYEFIRQTAPLIHEADLVNVMVTNGYIEEKPLQGLLPFIDAWNIDLKSFQEDYYRSICHGSLSPVMRTISLAAAVSHVEITTLIVPGKNDSIDDMDREAAWLASLRPDIPLHITRYFPRYHMTTAATSVNTLYALADKAKQYLRYVYIGNI
ncbi:MAG: AmmeMemoRadiSam system radical SAM enzyme [Megasphaera sp.]|jgi:pyruvate formate lyase activating enzyme|nr:AmmeMemoRadiSam system radical SAM enzyme [Megasphaera sp.]MCH4187375.1 AmmeMemoRadiSam system radical SAM enzyme [Megasphaera sp.]MCH4217557.1 AmmeMemoRadiSam system radical SAM enzyme [Megasphaera sp.]